MKKNIVTAVEFLVLLMIGICVFVVFSHMRPVLNRNADIVGRFLLSVLLLVSALLARRTNNHKKYWKILFAFFIAILTISVDYYTPSSRLLIPFSQNHLQTPAGIALDKLGSSIIIIGGIVVLTIISGEKLSSLFLYDGNVRESLKIGTVAFSIVAFGSVLIAKLFGAQDLSLERIIPWLPWILIFIAGNALNEELLFRGLFFKKLEPVLGGFLSNLVVAIPFVLHHTGVTYTNDVFMFLSYLLPLSLLWGYITQKTGSLWGAVLFHAGTDIPVVLVIFSKLA
ncbi:MAG TPA: hypothetical protein DCG34_04805 [Clostridiales bacterium]|jgi:membrane protease YdiL (CAAX protease family)|nr:hypothetical protein [Clostridiales bacterium]